MWQAIFTLIKLSGMFFTWRMEKNAERKKEKKEILEEVKNGVKESDVSRIHLGIERANRV